jgi:uncharacterized protein YqgQ
MEPIELNFEKRYKQKLLEQTEFLMAKLIFKKKQI